MQTRNHAGLSRWHYITSFGGGSGAGALAQGGRQGDADGFQGEACTRSGAEEEALALLLDLGLRQRVEIGEDGGPRSSRRHVGRGKPILQLLFSGGARGSCTRRGRGSSRRVCERSGASQTGSWRCGTRPPSSRAACRRASPPAARGWHWSAARRRIWRPLPPWRGRWRSLRRGWRETGDSPCCRPGLSPFFSCRSSAATIVARAAASFFISSTCGRRCSAVRPASPLSPRNRPRSSAWPE